jgi:hypothetical protein
VLVYTCIDKLIYWETKMENGLTSREVLFTENSLTEKEDL